MKYLMTCLILGFSLTFVKADEPPTYTGLKKEIDDLKARVTDLERKVNTPAYAGMASGAMSASPTAPNFTPQVFQSGYTANYGMNTSVSAGSGRGGLFQRIKDRRDAGRGAGAGVCSSCGG